MSRNIHHKSTSILMVASSLRIRSPATMTEARTLRDTHPHLSTHRENVKNRCEGIGVKLFDWILWITGRKKVYYVLCRYG